MIQSQEIPEVEVELGSKILVRYAVKEETVTDEVSGDEGKVYTYEELEFDKSVTKEVRDARASKAETTLRKNEAQEYMTSTGWVWEKYKRNVEVLQNITKEEFLEKYKEVISKQEECRKLL